MLKVEEGWTRAIQTLARYNRASIPRLYSIAFVSLYGIVHLHVTMYSLYQISKSEI